MTRKVKDMRSTLESKGFREDNTHHKAYWLFVDGKKTSVKTFFSHGLSEYGPNLLAKVRRQMKLNSLAEFDEFMDCTMDGAAYVKKMKERGVVKDQQSSPQQSGRHNKK